MSLIFARQAQAFSRQKDLSAFVREYRAKHAAIAQQAFENNVARPVGMCLDIVERMMNDTLKIRPVAEAELEGELRSRSTALMADHLTCLRLCREADDILSVDSAPARQHQRPFRTQYMAARLDNAFLGAIGAALRSSSAPAVDTATDAAAALKVALRKRLELERLAEAERALGGIRNDPLYPELVKWLPAGRGGADGLSHQAVVAERVVESRSRR